MLCAYCSFIYLGYMSVCPCPEVATSHGKPVKRFSTCVPSAVPHWTFSKKDAGLLMSLCLCCFCRSNTSSIERWWMFLQRWTSCSRSGADVWMIFHHVAQWFLPVAWHALWGNTSKTRHRSFVTGDTVERVGKKLVPLAAPFDVITG